MSQISKPNSSLTLRLIVAILAVCCYVGAYSLGNLTMVSFPIVVSVCVTGSAIIAVALTRLWPRFTGLSSPVANMTIATAIVGGFVTLIFYILNFTMADVATRHEVHAVVSGKYKEVRHRQKRVGRGRYVPGDPYNEYFLEISYPNGAVKPMLVKAEQYRLTDVGDSVKVNLCRGAFGFEVIKN